MDLQHLPELGPGGKRWVADTLLEGRSLARLVRETVDLDQLSVYAVVSGAVSFEQLERSLRGGLLAHQVEQPAEAKLTGALSSYAGRHFVLELPMDSPSDRWLSYLTGGTPTRMTCGEDVFAVCPIGEDRDLLQNTVLYSDATWGYDAFVVDGLPPDEIADAQRSSSGKARSRFGQSS